MTGIKTGIAVPCVGDVRRLIDFGVEAERRGFDGFFIWDHIVYSDGPEPPEIVDPWTVLSVVAARTSRIRIGPMITPISRRRPWTLARQCTSLDILSDGRLILGAGLGSPQRADFERLGEVADPRDRAALLDKGLDILDRLWSGEGVSLHSDRFEVDAVRFFPTPIQQPRIPVWIGGVLPATRPIRRAARWDGFVPIRFRDRALMRPSAGDVASVRADIARLRDERAVASAFDTVVWSPLGAEDDVTSVQVEEYAAAGATWWIDTGVPGPGWRAQVEARLRVGPRASALGGAAGGSGVAMGARG